MAFKQDGTKIQMAAGGASWIHDNPGDNPFLPMKYAQYSHFGKEDVKLTPQGSPGKGKTVTWILDNVGHVCLNMYVKIVSKGQLAWCAERSTQWFKLYSGDMLVDKYDLNYQRYHYNFMLNQDQKSKWDKMTSTENGGGEQLYLPLLFGFCQHDDQTLPTVAMFNRKIRVEMNFPGDSTGYKNYNNYSTMEVWATVAYLQGEEFNRVKFTNELLLFTTHAHDYKDLSHDPPPPWNIPAFTKLEQVLGLQRCVKQLLFGAYIYTGDFSKQNSFPFEWTGGLITDIFTTNAETCAQPHQSLGIVRLKSPNLMGSGNISSAEIIADKTNIIPLMDQKFFNVLQPYFHHSGCSAPGYMCYSWAMKPEISQPTGHINTSLFRDIKLNINFRPGLSDGLTDHDDEQRTEWYSDMITFMKKRNGMIEFLSQE